MGFDVAFTKAEQKKEAFRVGFVRQSYFVEQEKIKQRDWDVKINRHLFCTNQESRGLSWLPWHQTLARGVDSVTSAPGFFSSLRLFLIYFLISASRNDSTFTLNIDCKT